MTTNTRMRSNNEPPSSEDNNDNEDSASTGTIASTISMTSAIVNVNGVVDSASGGLEIDGHDSQSLGSPSRHPDLLPLSQVLTDEMPIDDDEFKIPQVDFEQSLESILSELDNQSLSDEDGIPDMSLPPMGAVHQLLPGQLLEGSDTVSIISKESSDNRSRSSSRSFRPRPNVTEKKKPASILRHVLLKGVTSQINSASEKINCGTATAIAIGSCIGIGTSHGYVLIFDVNQMLKWRLGEAEHRESGGSVSSLAISQTSTRLLIGYAKGLILMYDLENGKLLRVLTDCHAAGTAVLILRFTDYPILALCSDSGGSVFELNFKRTMGVRGCDSRCIFSGSRGEVCTFEPLLLSSFPDNPLTKYVIVAFATLSKIIVVMIRPKLKVLFTHTLQCSPATLPLLSWQMVIIQTTSNENIVDPVLSFARENTVSFYQVTLDSKNAVQFLPLRTFTVPYHLISMHWLNPRTIALIDTKEKIHVMDVRSQEQLESIDLSSARLVYSSSHFKGLATGGNVSRAFAMAGELACYNSILCLNNQMIVLGTKSVHALTMRVWYERLDYLVRQLHFMEAIQLGYELYLEKAKAIIGLKGSKDSKRLIVREKLLWILDRYFDRIPLMNFMDDLSSAKQNYKEIISTCIHYNVILDNLGPVFDKIYEFCTENPFSKSAYLESLEPYILNDQLRAIPPIIVKEFITYYEENGNFKPLEACIVHINVDSLDIHQTMKLCWTQGLYDAIIYIYNRGMHDYISPLEELMTELHSAISTENQLTDSQVKLGNKILVYTSCCMAGRAYPYGNIPPQLVESVQSDIFRCITTLHTRNSPENEAAYPYLRTFLQFDTKEFLNVLSLSFEEPIFQTELGRRQKQRMVDILLQVMVEQGNFTPTQVGVLFTFLARQMAKAENSLYVSKLLFEQVLEHLTSANETSRIDERQQALLELLQAGGLQHFDHDKLLEKCRNAKFFRVCEMLYERRKQYEQIIDCYLLDEARKHQVFSFLHKIFCVIPSKKDELQNKVRDCLENLVEIDSKKTAQVVYLHLGNLIPELVRSLGTKPEKQYLFLQGVFYIREQSQNNIEVDTLTTEKYVDLMCRFNPQSVQPFLKSVDSYRMEQTLQICNKYKLHDAICYLLERDGQVSAAFELMMKEFREKLDLVFEEIERLEASGAKPKEAILDSSLKWMQLQGFFLVMIQFSQRNSPKLPGNEREKLWLPPLNLLIAAHNKFQGKDELSLAFNDLNKHLLSSMMGHVSLPTIVEVVLNNPSYQSSTFAEIRDLVMGMLETCTYEEMMVTLVKRITQLDVHEKLETKLKTSKGPFSFSSKICRWCHSDILNDIPLASENIVVFKCGHPYHLSCCEKKNLKACPFCRANIPSTSSLQDVDVSFVLPRLNFFENEENISQEENQEVPAEIHSAGFELKLHAPFKVSLKEF